MSHNSHAGLRLRWRCKAAATGLDWLPELLQNDTRFAHITLRHLLLMRSGNVLQRGLPLTVG